MPIPLESWLDRRTLAYPYKSPYLKRFHGRFLKGNTLGRIRFPSLVHLNLMILADNITEASLQALEHLPFELLCRLYKYVVIGGAMTFETWRMFSQLLTTELSSAPLGLYWFRGDDILYSEALSNDLSRVIQGWVSPTVDFLTHIAIHNVQVFKASDLMALADMPNLAILELSDSDPTAPGYTTDNDTESAFSDRLVRGWSEKERPFPNLRILWIRSTVSNITLHTLKYASRFPSLVVCHIEEMLLGNETKADTKKRAETLGWGSIKLDNNFYDEFIKVGKILGPKSEEWRFPDHLRPKPTSLMPSWGINLKNVLMSHLTLCQQNNQAAGAGAQAGNGALQAWPAHPGVVDQVFLVENWNAHHEPINWCLWDLYSYFGRAVENVDLVNQGVKLDRRVSDQEDVPMFPPKPMASLTLGCTSPIQPLSTNFDDLGTKTFTFVRSYSPTMTSSMGAAEGLHKTGTSQVEKLEKKRADPSVGSTFNPRKRRNLGDFIKPSST